MRGIAEIVGGGYHHILRDYMKYVLRKAAGRKEMGGCNILDSGPKYFKRDVEK